MLSFVVGCGGESNAQLKKRLEKVSGGKMKVVVPVSGKVTVDGKAAAGVDISIHKMTGGNPLRTTSTDKDGKYCWSTYLTCDGLEAGEYKITIKYIPKTNHKGEGTDVLGGQYADPAKSEYKLTVAEGSPQKDVNYDLATKK
jgi:hypothetical protein